jgi:hypothetical protein
MYLGYIVGDEHPLLETIGSSVIENRDKPVLIVGLNRAMNLYPDLVSPTEKKIKDNIYYIFSESESDKYEESLNTFLYYCYKEKISEFKIIKNYLNFDNVIPLKNVFIYETDKIITITSGNLIYYIDKEIYEYFNSIKINTKKLISDLKKQFPNSLFYSWNYPFYFQSYLKTIEFYISLKDFKTLHFFDENFDLYIGAVCLEWLKKLTKQSLSEETLSTWNKAYETEDFFSSIKVKIDKVKLGKLEDNSTTELSKNLIDSDYIIQKYNGTDKATGRMYSAKGFNLQTLSEVNRDLVIAEPKCLLFEFDYNYFEYTLLRQVCGLEFAEDPHLKLSEYLFKSSEYRDIAKGINYSILYGLTLKNAVKKIKKEYPSFNLNEDLLLFQLKEFIKPFLPLQNKLIEEFNKHKRVTNFFGRSVYPEHEYTCLNYYTQSTAADLFIRKIDKIRIYLKQLPSINKILLQKHDSMLFNFNIDVIENTTLLTDIIEILESKQEGLFAKVSLKTGSNWKEMK